MIVVIEFWSTDDKLQKKLNALMKHNDRLITVLRGELEDNGTDFGCAYQAIFQRKEKRA